MGPTRNLRLCLLACLLLAIPAQAQVQPKPPARLTVVTDINFPPYFFEADDGTRQGITVDKWALWSRKTGIPVKVEGLEWSKAQERLQAGLADVIDPISFTQARTSFYEFSPAYAPSEAHVFFHRSITGISDVRSMRGFTIGAKDGSACGDWLQMHGIDTIRKYGTAEGLIHAAGAGDVRLFCMDIDPAKYLLFKLSLAEEFRQSPALYRTEFHWAVKKGRGDLRQFVQQGFDAVGPQALADIDARWLGNPLRLQLGQRYVPWIAAGAAAALALAVALILWNRTLRSKVAARTGELREQAERFRDLYDNAPCGYHSLDENARFVEMNRTELQWLGYTREEVVGRMYLRDLLTPPARERIGEAFERFKRTGILQNAPYDYVRKDGSLISVRVSSSAIRDASGNFVMSRTTVNDVSEQAAAADALAYRNRLESLILAISVRFLATPPGETGARIQEALQEVGAFMDADRSFVHLIDESGDTYTLAHEWCGPGIASKREIRQSVPMERAGPLWDAMRRNEIAYVNVADLPEGSVLRETLSLGRIRSTIGVPMIIENNLIGCLALDAEREERRWPDETRVLLRVVADIIGNAIQRGRSDEALRELNSELEERVASRTRELEAALADLESFAYTVSHDLRAPLRHIASYVDLARREIAGNALEQASARLERARNAAARLDRMILALLELSQKGQVALQLEEVDVDEVVAEVVEELRTQAGERRVEWRIGRAGRCVADRALLRNALSNLLGNALKFTRGRDPARIELETTGQSDTSTTFCVRDNGAGFDMAFADKLFGVFSRLHADSEFEGTGIGLASTRQALQRMGGSIRAEARVDEGAVFYFTLQRVVS